MSASEHSISVEDVRKLALPINTRVVAGGASMARVVTWATVFYPEWQLASRTLQRGEMILLASAEKPDARNLQTLDLLRWAEKLHASAIVLSETVSPALIAEANAVGMPLLVLPPTERIRGVERAVVSLLVDRKGQLERRGTQIYRQLTEISTRNEGMAELLQAMARLTNKTIVIQDKRLLIQEQSVQPHLMEEWDDIEAFMKSQSNLPVEFQDRMRLNETDSPVLMQGLPVPGMARLVSPIITKGIGRGYLSIIGLDTDLDDVDTLVAEHGAAACALEMAKAKAISETEKRLRGTFLDRLLLGDVNQQEAVRQGERFKHDMTPPHIAIVLGWRGEKTPSIRRLETIVNTVVTQTRAAALVWQRGESEVIVFHAPDNKDLIDSSMKLARAFAVEVSRQSPGAHVAIGLGQIARDLTAWRSSHEDAQQAMKLAARLQTDSPLYIGDLGVYQLLLSLNDREKLLAFCHDMLGKLEEYDHSQNSDLIKTLEAYFACHGNLSQAKEMLIVHRNTLLYRMNRIREIANVDLDRAETRLALHLALTVRRLLSSGQS